MKKLAFLCMTALAPFAMLGCEETAMDQKADEIRADSEAAADVVEAEGAAVEESADAHADTIRAEGEAAADATEDADDTAPANQ